MCATVIDDINFNPEFLEPYLEQTVQLIFKVRAVYDLVCCTGKLSQAHH
jgi:hypothetical protein